MEQARNMARIVCHALEEKKGEAVTVLDISKVSIMADYFVIANGNNDSQVRALVENVDEKMQEAGFTLKQQEGKGGAWVLMDYGDVIVHIFDKENRLFYNLERIWSDGVVVEDL
ncbi:MAG: ribosome silencing factor [Lachnospiraceae bacterium]